MRLLLLGCSGFIGRELVPKLLNADHEVTLVSRKTSSGINQANHEDGDLTFLQLDPSDPGNWQNESLLSALEGAEGVVNLVGEPIAEKRWTLAHRMKLSSSRLDTTNALVSTMRKLKRSPRVLVNASAIGYYGTSQDNYFNEVSSPGEDFLANLCQEWETAAANKPNFTRLLVVRIGIVLGADGGALGKMLPIFKTGLGGPIGTGKQWMSWIHRTDLCELIKNALENRKWSGVVNGVAPEPVSMENFSLALGKTLGRPTLLPVPGPLLKLLLGDGARIVLEGQHVQSKRLQKLGFSFKYPELNQALEAIIRN